jgi:hypothetical protein
VPSIPRPIVSVHGEDVDIEVPGIVTLRASFLSEGLFDNEAGGLPDEEDLYEVEVTHARDILLQPITFARLMPASSREMPDEFDEDAAIPGSELPIERFLMLLAWELANAHPTNWQALCDRARLWDSWTLEDGLYRMPPEWKPEPLLPDED